MQTKKSLQALLIVVFGSRDCCYKIAALSRILVNPFALSMNNLLNVVSLRKNQVDYLGKSLSQTNILKRENIMFSVP